MLAKLVNSRALLQLSMALLAILICEERCYSHGFELQSGNFTGVQRHSLTFTTQNLASIDVLFGDDGVWTVRVPDNKAFWDIETDEGKKQLSAFLEAKAQRQLEELVKQKQFTPEQLTKLAVAVRIQVARDCRTVQELVSTSVKAIRETPMVGVPQLLNDELGLSRTSIQMTALFDTGIGRDDSLFTKVVNHLK